MPLPLFVLLSFILSAPYPFDATFLYYAFLPLCSASLLTIESFPMTTTTPSLLCSTLLYAMCSLCMQYFPCLCMLTPRQIFCTSRVLFLIIATLQLLWWFTLRVQYHWVLCWYSSASLAVETLCLLCDSRAHLLYSSYRPQFSSSYQSPPRTSLSLLKIPRDSSPPLSIIPKCLRVLWQKPSVVSGSYTVSCYISPPILFKFTCTVGFTPWDLSFIFSFRHSSIQHSCDHVSLHSQSRSPKRSLVALALSSISHRCDQGLWPQPLFNNCIW